MGSSLQVPAAPLLNQLPVYDLRKHQKLAQALGSLHAPARPETPDPCLWPGSTLLFQPSEQ